VIQDLEAGNGVATIVTLSPAAPDEIFTTSADTDTWTASRTTVDFGAGPVPLARITTDNGAGWILDDNRTVTGGARLDTSGTWTSWTPPCTGVNGDASLAAASDTDLVAVCDVGAWGPPNPAPPGYSTSGYYLYTSTDGGSTFSAGTLVPNPIGMIATPSSAPDTIVGTGNAGLVATFDGGKTWSTVLPLSGASVSFLGFTTSSQGVAIEVQANGLPALLMTHDGGHTWPAVSF
jgi:hypothetical protein